MQTRPPSGVWSRARSSSIASLPAHTCSRNSASITCAARTMCASACRSFAGSAEMIGAEIGRRKARDLLLEIAGTRRGERRRQQRNHKRVLHGTFNLKRGPQNSTLNAERRTLDVERRILNFDRGTSVNAGRRLQGRRFGAESANRRFPHLIHRHVEHQIRPAPAPSATPRRRARVSSCPGAPAGVADDETHPRIGRRLQRAPDHRGRRRQVHAVDDLEGVGRRARDARSAPTRGSARPGRRQRGARPSECPSAARDVITSCAGSVIGRLTTSPNAPCEPYSASRTTLRTKLGSSICGIETSRRKNRGRTDLRWS